MNITEPDPTWSPEDLARYNSMRKRFTALTLPMAFRFLAACIDHARANLDATVRTYMQGRTMTLISEGADVEWVSIDRVGEDQYVVSATAEFDNIHENV
jgi:hypothetical protein